VIKVDSLKILCLVLELSLNLLVDIFVGLEFVDFGWFFLTNGMTHGQNSPHSLDRLINSNVVAVKYGKESSLEYFLVLFFIFFRERGEFLSEVAESLDLKMVVLLVFLDA
jgi:hypothetical protein